LFEGPEAVLFARDPELIKQITIKDYDHFMDLLFTPVVTKDIYGNDLGLLNSTGEEWKKVRAAFAPAFSPKNLKNVTKAINEVT